MSDKQRKTLTTSLFICCTILVMYNRMLALIYTDKVSGLEVLTSMDIIDSLQVMAGWDWVSLAMSVHCTW